MGLRGYLASEMTSALRSSTPTCTSVSDLSWFVNAYTPAFATFKLPAATLGDRWGRRRVMLGGVALFTIASIASIASALSTTSSALIVAHAFQGLGAAAVMPPSLTLLRGAEPADRARLLAVRGGPAHAALDSRLRALFAPGRGVTASRDTRRAP
ncbi:MAG: MFS transporter [Nocardioidaceae bacterium]